MDVQYYLRKLVDLILALVGVVIGLRFVLRLFGANAGNNFVDWIYETSGEMLSPFRNIFSSTVIDGGFVIDFTALFGLLVYGLAALLAVHLIDLWTPKRK